MIEDETRKRRFIGDSVKRGLISDCNHTIIDQT